MKQYLHIVNSEASDMTQVIAGFIAITTVDTYESQEDGATTIKLADGKFCYPEIILLDCFSRFKKIGAVDIYDPSKTTVYTKKESGQADVVETAGPLRDARNEDAVFAFLRKMNDMIAKFTIRSKKGEKDTFSLENLSP